MEMNLVEDMLQGLRAMPSVVADISKVQIISLEIVEAECTGTIGWHIPGFGTVLPGPRIVERFTEPQSDQEGMDRNSNDDDDKEERHGNKRQRGLINLAPPPQ